MISFSIIIPFFNEEKNIENLLIEIKNCLENYNSNYELILINDGSTDKTLSILEKYKKISFFKKIKLINNSINYGQSRCIFDGIKIASYDAVVTIDGDGQNNPKDILRLIKFFHKDNKVKLVGGIRKNRRDTKVKILSSRIANFIRSKIFSDNCPDTGCSLKVIDKNQFLQLPFFDGLHRFIPTLFTGLGAKTIFIDVDHRPRKYGISKYGTFKRLFRGIMDMYKVYKIINIYKKIKK